MLSPQQKEETKEKVKNLLLAEADDPEDFKHGIFKTYDSYSLITEISNIIDSEISKAVEETKREIIVDIVNNPCPQFEDPTNHFLDLPSLQVTPKK